jgi:hypothetical protein
LSVALASPPSAAGDSPTATDGASAVAWLESHPNWSKLGPVRKEVAVLLALNEFDPDTGIFSQLTNRELALKYPEYNASHFKNTFQALRRYGIAKPEERFVPANGGSRQIATRYTLDATPDGQPWSTGDFRTVRAKKAHAARRSRKKVGRLTFTPKENKELRRLMELRASALNDRPHLAIERGV